MLTRLAIVSLLACTAFGAVAQVAPAKKPELIASADPEARCRKDVRAYVDAMKFVRQSAGDQIGNRVAGGYVSEEELEKVAAAQGACAAATLLKERGAPR